MDGQRPLVAPVGAMRERFEVGSIPADADRGAAPYVLLLIAGPAVVMICPDMAMWLPGKVLNLRS